MRSRESKQYERECKLAEIDSAFPLTYRRLKVMANPVRMMILEQLMKGTRNVKYLTFTLGIEQPSISRHLKELLAERFVTRQKRNNEMYYSLQKSAISGLISDLENSFLMEH
jgi:DNA-binding transcriptional ArsR family regulator